MNLFYRAFNARTLAAIGITLSPQETSEFIEWLAGILRKRLTPGADVQVECMRLFQEVEAHVGEIMGNGREKAA